MVQVGPIKFDVLNNPELVHRHLAYCYLCYSVVCVGLMCLNHPELVHKNLAISVTVWFDEVRCA